MGSCSTKTTTAPINSIKALTLGENNLEIPKSDEMAILKVPSPSNRNQELNRANINQTDKRKFTIEVTPEDQKSRRLKKKLTVLSTNEDEIDLPKELSFVHRRSLGKDEQGSLLIVKRPVMYGGKISNKTQNEFEDKLMTIEGDDVKRESLLEHGIWVSCKKGLKPEYPNQDDFVILIDNESVLLGVFDGHGTHGHDVSNFIHQSFPRVLVSSDFFETDPARALSDAFFTVHNQLVSYCNKNPELFDCTLSGSTSTLVCIKQHKLYVGHVGDSRAVLGRRVKGKITAVDLTRDHKPTLDDEIARITRMGGEVKRLEDDVPYRVFLKGKQYPGIAMSRTIGDLLAQTVGVTCSPEVNEYEITGDDEFVVACSDGVWEFISSQEAVEELSKPWGNIKNAAEALATLAWNRWITNEEDVVDDITVVLVNLKSY